MRPTLPESLGFQAWRLEYSLYGEVRTRATIVHWAHTTVTTKTSKGSDGHLGVIVNELLGVGLLIGLNTAFFERVIVTKEEQHQVPDATSLRQRSESNNDIKQEHVPGTCGSAGIHPPRRS